MKRIAMLWCAMCALSPDSAAQSSYVMIDLGLPPARTALFAMDVDDTGRVLVYAPTGNGTRSYSWENGVFTDLGAMSGFARMEGADRDTASGVIVGSSWSSSGFPARAWKLTASGYQDLGALGGGNANAYAINAFGHVTGWAYAPAPANFFAFVHDGQQMHNLGEFVADITSTGFDINDSGWVAAAGFAPFGFNLAGVAHLDEGVHPIGTLGGPRSFTTAINASGHIAGTSDTRSPANNKDQYLTRAFLWRNGTMTDLGVIAGHQRSSAADLNDSDVVVGGCWKDLSFSSQRAFRWRDGQMTDLNSMVSGGTGQHTLLEARRVNNAGVMLVNTSIGAQRRVVLLVPNP